MILEVLLAQVSHLCPHYPSEFSQSSFLRMAGATPTFARTNNLMIGASAFNDTLGLDGACLSACSCVVSSPSFHRAD